VVTLFKCVQGGPKNWQTFQVGQYITILKKLHFARKHNLLTMENENYVAIIRSFTDNNM